MQFRLGHGALESKHEAIVEQPRMVESVGIADQRIGRPAQVQQSIPIGIVARQARDLQREDDAHLSKRDLSGQLGEPRTRTQTRARDPQVLVDDLDLRGWPAELRGKGL